METFHSSTASNNFATNYSDYLFQHFKNVHNFTNRCSIVANNLGLN